MSTLTFGQSKVDIEIKVEFSRDSVRGGEELPFTATVRNIGQERATDVILTTGEYGPLNIISGEPDLGKCVLGKGPHQDKFRCEFGNIGPGASATIRGIIKIADWDVSTDPREIEAAKGLVEAMQRAYPNSDTQPVDERSNLGTFWVAPAEAEDNRDNNYADLKIKVLPSVNKAPQIKILSPKNEGTLIRPAGQPFSYAVSIEAGDIDGKVVAVTVVEPKHDIRPVGMNEKGYLFEYEGVQYSAVELEEYLRKNPPSQRLATQTGKNTYAYTMTDPPYGHNQLHVTAVDDSGREANTWISFEIKADSTIEIISPKADQIISPGSTLTVETISKLKSGRLKDVSIVGDGIQSDSVELVKMALVSKQGNMYRHRFEIKGVQENSVYSHVRVMLLEDTGGYADAGVGYLVRDLPIISFTSFKDGDTVEPSELPDAKAEKVDVSIEIENRISNDDYELFIDGKYHTTMSSESIYWLNPAKGKHTLQVVASFGKTKKVKLARSPLITVTVR